MSELLRLRFDWIITIKAKQIRRLCRTIHMYMAKDWFQPTYNPTTIFALVQQCLSYYRLDDTELVYRSRKNPSVIHHSIGTMTRQFFRR